jgi:hypothetical protein
VLLLDGYITEAAPNGLERHPRLEFGDIGDLEVRQCVKPPVAAGAQGCKCVGGFRCAGTDGFEVSGAKVITVVGVELDPALFGSAAGNTP